MQSPKCGNLNETLDKAGRDSRLRCAAMDGSYSRFARARRLSRMPLPPFQRFLDEHGTAVHRYLVVAVGPDAADDCWQESMLAALRAYRSVREPASLRGWALSIARLKALDAHRAGRRRLELELVLPRPEPAAPPNPQTTGCGRQ